MVDNLKNIEFMDLDFLVDDGGNIDCIAEYKSRAALFLKSIDSKKVNYIYWIIWGWGVWKSTYITTIKSKDKTGKWVLFDSREFPDRKDLWDGFILKFIWAVANDTEVDKFMSRVDGRIYIPKNVITQITYILPAVIIAFFLHYIDLSFKTDIISVYKIFKDIIWNGLIALLLGMIWVATFLIRINKDPVSRVLSYQKNFKFRLDKFLLKDDREFDKIVVVLEDIDRSWDEWIFFMETLKNFFSKNAFDVPVIFLCPITSHSLESNFQKYIKCFDTYDFFVKEFNLEAFFINAFIWLSDNDVASEKFNLFFRLCSVWLKNYTAREHKLIFRMADNLYKASSYKVWYKLDGEIFFVLYCWNLIKDKTGDSKAGMIRLIWGNNSFRSPSDRSINYTRLLHNFLVIKWHMEPLEAWDDITGTISYVWDSFKYVVSRTRQDRFDIYVPIAYMQ